MLVLSSSEFRARQRHYFSRVSAGEEVLVKIPQLGTFRIQPVAGDTASETVAAQTTDSADPEFMAKLCNALKEIKLHREGKLHLPTLDDLLDEL